MTLSYSYFLLLVLETPCDIVQVFFQKPEVERSRRMLENLHENGKRETQSLINIGESIIQTVYLSVATSVAQSRLWVKPPLMTARDTQLPTHRRLEFVDLTTSPGPFFA